jgi:glycosyltransferase involved in cell wall biosynthesis
VFSSAVRIYFLYVVKVLIIHQYFKTPEGGGALRSYYLARALVEAGMEVSVITTHNAPNVVTATVDGIRVHYLPVVYSNSFGFFRRVASFLKFVFSIVREAKNFRDASLCYALSTPLTTGLAAMWIKRRYRIPFVFEVGDLWPEAPVQLGIVRNPLLKRVLYGMERMIYRSAKEVVALSDDIRAAIVQVVPRKRVPVIPNMADTDYYFPQSKTTALESTYQVQGKFVIAYTGTLGMANGLDYLMACAENVLHKLPVHFLIAGEGAEENRLRIIIQEKKLTNVSLLPFQTRAGVRDIIHVSDAIFVSFLPAPVLETGSPNKYFDGLAAGKMVINNFGGWMKREIESHRIGFSLHGIPATEFTAHLEPFVRDAAQLQSCQQAARALAESQYARKALSARLLQVIHEMTAR